MSDQPLNPSLHPVSAPVSRNILERTLATAIRWWLRSRLDGVDRLDIDLRGTAAQFLAGQIPQVALRAWGAIYQGIHLNYAAATAGEIAINLGQMRRGAPLQLSQPIALDLEVCLSQIDLERSLQDSLMVKQALQDLLGIWLGDAIPSRILRLTLGDGCLEIEGLAADRTPWYFSASPKAGDRTLLLTSVCLKREAQWQPLPDRAIDLGDAVVTALVIHDGKLQCRGQLWVKP